MPVVSRHVVPVDRLPEDRAARDELLQRYFPDQTVAALLTDAGWELEVEFFERAEEYVDPRLAEGLDWWRPGMPVEDVPWAVRVGTGGLVTLNDAWTLWSWSRWFERCGLPEQLCILHADDHDDLMPPRLVWRGGRWRDVLTGRHVDMRDPATVEAAIRSGAVGMGSFLTPLVHAIPRLAISHLSSADYICGRQGALTIAPAHRHDELLDPISRCPAVMLQSAGETSVDCPAGARYRATSDPVAWTAGLPVVPTFLHIDMDYFCNPFNRDSDWQVQPARHNSDDRAVLDAIDCLFETLVTGGITTQVVDVTIALPAGFFPAQLWRPSMERIEQHLTRLCLPNPFPEGGSHGN